jgi:hypothetical protein
VDPLSPSYSDPRITLITENYANMGSTANLAGPNASGSKSSRFQDNNFINKILVQNLGPNHASHLPKSTSNLGVQNAPNIGAESHDDLCTKICLVGMENDRLATREKKLHYELSKKNSALEECQKKIEVLERLKQDGTYLHEEKYIMLRRENERLDTSLRDAGNKTDLFKRQIAKLEHQVETLKNSQSDGGVLNSKSAVLHYTKNENLAGLLDNLAFEHENLKRESLETENQMRTNNIDSQHRIKTLQENYRLLALENERLSGKIQSQTEHSWETKANLAELNN